MVYQFCVYKNDDTKAVDSMLFIDILRKDIIEVDAKNKDNLRIWFTSGFS